MHAQIEDNHDEESVDSEIWDLHTYEAILEEYSEKFEERKNECLQFQDGKYAEIFFMLIHPYMGKQPPSILEPYLNDRIDRATIFKSDYIEDLFIETIHEHHPDILEIFAKHNFPFFKITSGTLPNPNLLASAIRFNNLSSAKFLFNLDYLDREQKIDSLFDVMSSLCIRGHHSGKDCESVDMRNGQFDEETLVPLMQFCLYNGAELNTRRFELIQPETFRILLTAQLSLGRDIKDLLNTDLARSELFRRRTADIVEDCHDSIYDVALLLLLDEQSIILTDNIKLLEPASKHPHNKHLTNDVSGTKTSLQSIFRPEEARAKAIELKENAFKYTHINNIPIMPKAEQSQKMNMSNIASNQREQDSASLTSPNPDLNKPPQYITNSPSLVESIHNPNCTSSNR